jgi:hypothetical protein
MVKNWYKMNVNHAMETFMTQLTTNFHHHRYHGREWLVNMKEDYHGNHR